MQDLYQEDLTEELIERLSKEITFMEPVNLSKYDTITIIGETIELYHEEYDWCLHRILVDKFCINAIMVLLTVTLRCI